MVTVSKTKLFFSHMIPAVMRPMRVLWNELIGFVFIILAVWATPSAIRNIRSIGEPDGGLFRAALSLFFAALMAFFGITSFLRARRISRS